MAIQQCSECGGKVSTTAKVCPHCGHSMTFGRQGLEAGKDLIGGIWSLMIVLFAVVTFFALVKGCANVVF